MFQLHVSAYIVIWLMTDVSIATQMSFFLERNTSLDDRDFASPDFTYDSFSVLDCGTLCAVDSNCVYIVFNQNTLVCKLFQTNLDTSSPSVQGLGWIALYKYKGPSSCVDLMNNNQHNSGIYTIYPEPYPAGLQGYCDQTTGAGGWLVIQRRVNEIINFRRTYKEYEDGFGDLEQSFWIGNKVLHELTTSSMYKLRVDLWRWSGEYGYAEFSTFIIGNASSRYELTVTGFTGNATASLLYHSGCKFYTYEQDNANNCASKNNGGWWYNICHRANLNGKYFTSQQINSTGITWNDWIGFETLRTVHMKMKIR